MPSGTHGLGSRCATAVKVVMNRALVTVLPPILSNDCTIFLMARSFRRFLDGCRCDGRREGQVEGFG